VNPVFCLDEVDKMSTDFRGDPSAALLEVLDPEQNYAFNDHYLDVDYNLSEVMFITTANTLYSIPAPLQDRMEIIRLPGYTELEKLAIAKGSYCPSRPRPTASRRSRSRSATGPSWKSSGATPGRPGCATWSGKSPPSAARSAKKLVTANDREGSGAGAGQRLESYLGVPKFRYGLPEERDFVGLANGLAWTEVGGEVLTTEAVIMPGKGKLTITGKLGEVMQESAQAALSYVRSRGRSLGLPEDFYTRWTCTARARRGHPQGRALGRHHPGHRPGQRAHPHSGALRCGHDRRDHAAGQGAAHRRPARKGPGRP
jgi:ATP-dependent Lon protease